MTHPSKKQDAFAEWWEKNKPKTYTGHIPFAHRVVWNAAWDAALEKAAEKLEARAARMRQGVVWRRGHPELIEELAQAIRALRSGA